MSLQASDALSLTMQAREDKKNKAARKYEYIKNKTIYEIDEIISDTCSRGYDSHTTSILIDIERRIVLDFIVDYYRGLGYHVDINNRMSCLEISWK